VRHRIPQTQSNETTRDRLMRVKTRSATTTTTVTTHLLPSPLQIQVPTQLPASGIARQLHQTTTRRCSLASRTTTLDKPKSRTPCNTASFRVSRPTTHRLCRHQQSGSTRANKHRQRRRKRRRRASSAMHPLTCVTKTFRIVANSMTVFSLPYLSIRTYNQINVDSCAAATCQQQPTSDHTTRGNTARHNYSALPNINGRSRGPRP
jgi:hypothetical protein